MPYDCISIHRPTYTEPTSKWDWSLCLIVNPWMYMTPMMGPIAGSLRTNSSVSCIALLRIMMSGRDSKSLQTSRISVPYQNSDMGYHTFWEQRCQVEASFTSDWTLRAHSWNHPSSCGSLNQFSLPFIHSSMDHSPLLTLLQMHGTSCRAFCHCFLPE